MVPARAVRVWLYISMHYFHFVLNSFETGICVLKLFRGTISDVMVLVPVPLYYDSPSLGIVPRSFAYSTGGNPISTCPWQIISMPEFGNKTCIGYINNDPQFIMLVLVVRMFLYKNHSTPQSATLLVVYVSFMLSWIQYLQWYSCVNEEDKQICVHSCSFPHNKAS